VFWYLIQLSNHFRNHIDLDLVAIKLSDVYACRFQVQQAISDRLLFRRFREATTIAHSTKTYQLGRRLM
jgi:hypothetical protein